MNENEHRYDDIIECERPEPKTRMDMKKRAAIFAPFAALSGFDEVIKEETVKNSSMEEKK